MGSSCSGVSKVHRGVKTHPRDFNAESIKFNEANTLSKEEAITSHTNITQVYHFKKVIGHGHFGTVRIATLISNPEKKFAIKTIEKAKVKKELHLLRRELMILKRLDHPNIVKFYETYQDEKFFYLVMEHCSGGELLERIIDKGKLEEVEVAKIMQKAFSAVKHLHSIGIVHRDLKPENFLFSSKEPDAELKLIDFGLSKFLGNNPDSKLNSVVGTALYVSPEVLKGRYDERCDNWSLGVLLFVLLSGSPPFDGDNQNQIFQKVAIGKYSMNKPEWKRITKQAKDLISKLLVLDPETRYTASEALEHEWFKIKLPKKVGAADPAVLDMLKNFRSGKKFKNEILKVMVHFLTDAELKKLTEEFRSIDKDGTGYISVHELQQTMKELGQDVTTQQIESLMKTIKIEGNMPMINYTEFIAATMDKKKYLTKEKLWAAFKHFDVDNSNEITVDNIKEAMARGGRKMPEEEIKKMIKDVDFTKDGKITYDEFFFLMTHDDENLELAFNDSRAFRTFRSESMDSSANGATSTKGHNNSGNTPIHKESAHHSAFKDHTAPKLSPRNDGQQQQI